MAAYGDDEATPGKEKEKDNKDELMVQN